MAKNAGFYRSTDNLLQVAGFLKQADKLVREQNYSQALEQIGKARAKDPTNSYAEAYEQRVRLLLSALTDRKQSRANTSFADPRTSHSFTQHLESIASLAIEEAQRSAGISLRQALDCQHGNLNTNEAGLSMQAADIRREGSENKEEQIRQCIRYAENFLRDQKFDEALNILLPAILLDPLNEQILRLERRVHDAQGERFFGRVHLSESNVEQRQKAYIGNNQEIQRYVQLALDYSRRKEFSEALKVLGQGYLLDPFNVSLATCEQNVLTAIARENSRSGSALSGKGVTSTGSGTERSAATGSVLEFLRQAEKYLDDDRFPEALAEVASAIIAVQHRKESDDIEREASIRNQNAHRDFPDAGSGFHSMDERSENNSRQILDLLDEARMLANKEEFGLAIDILLRASSLIPSDGSLRALEYQLGQRFMEYVRLIRAGGSIAPDGDRVQATPSAKNSSGVPKPVHIVNAPSPPQPIIAGGERSSAKQTERQLALAVSPVQLSNDRISQIRGHLSRALHHLNNMKLVEASVEAEIAGLVDSSRKDVNLFATAVAGLSRKAKTQVTLNALSDTYESIRQQAKDLIYASWYEEMLNGMNRILDVLPASDILRKRKVEIEQSFQEFKQSTSVESKFNGLALELPKRNAPTARKGKKQGLGQFGLSFSEEPGEHDEVGEDRLNDNAGTMETLPIRKPLRQASSGQSYLGN